MSRPLVSYVPKFVQTVGLYGTSCTCVSLCITLRILYRKLTQPMAAIKNKPSILRVDSVNVIFHPRGQ